MPPTPALTCRPVSSAKDLEAMRLIRNACRSYMTRHRAEISADEQLRWWRQLDRGRTQCYLFTCDGADAGFGVIRSEGDASTSGARSWLTGGLLPEYRGKGLGTCLFRILVSLCPRRPYLEVFRQNEPARRLYERLGFSVIDQTQDIITMVLAQ